jgi:UDP-N-acetylenolpyruvoylglucosamine reductase
MNDTYTPQCTLRNRKKLPRNYEYRHLGSWFKYQNPAWSRN